MKSSNPKSTARSRSGPGKRMYTRSLTFNHAFQIIHFCSFTAECHTDAPSDGERWSKMLYGPRRLRFASIL